MFDQLYNNNEEGGVFVYNRQANGLWVQNGMIRVPTGPVLPLVGDYALSATSPTGFIIAVASSITPNIVLFS